MSKWREKHPFEDNAFADGLLEYMDSPEGQRSIEVADALWALMEDVQLDARRREFLWPKAQPLTFAQSIERIQKEYPDFPRQRIVSFLISYLEHYAPDDYSEEQLDELDQLAEEWINELEREHGVQ